MSARAPQSLSGEDAPARTARRRGRVPAYALGALGVLWLVYAMNASTRQLFYFVLPSMVTEFQLTPEMTGVISAIVTVAVSLLALPLGPWSDRGGHGWARKYRNGVVALGYFAFSILSGVAALTASVWSLVALQSVKNAFGGAGEAAEVSSLGESYPVEKRGLALGLHHTAYPWGVLLTGFLVCGILAWFGTENWRYVFLITPLLMVPIWIGYWRFATRARYERFERETVEAGLTPPLRAADATEPARPGVMRRALRNPNVLVPALGSFVGIAVFTGISFWLPQYIAFVGEYSFADAAGYSALFTITGGVGQILWGWVSDHLGRKVTALIIFTWLAVGTVLLQFASNGLAWLVVLQLFVGMATNGIFPVLYGFAADSAEPGGLGTANAVLLSTMYLGGVSPLVIGVLISAGGGYGDPLGYDWSLYVMAALCVVGAVVVALFTRETVGRFRHLDRALVSRESCGLEDAVLPR